MKSRTEMSKRVIAARNNPIDRGGTNSDMKYRLKTRAYKNCGLGYRGFVNFRFDEAFSDIPWIGLVGGNNDPIDSPSLANEDLFLSVRENASFSRLNPSVSGDCRRLARGAAVTGVSS
ncbi:MAG: hypothetical protein KC994_07080, partial [Candidatus Omnitrophica bacterium]|nr:hypothetical protein [Candidatus Omnitrophota bacterium]